MQIVDVAPRDGLQSEAVVLPTETKIELVDRLVDAGIRRVETVSFARPTECRRWPTPRPSWMACHARTGSATPGLVLNERGVDRAVAARVDEINVVVVATDTFSSRNQNTTTEGALAAWSAIAGKAAAAGIPATVTVAAAFGCPYEGEVPVERLVQVAAAAAEANPTELVLADTIGVAVPSDVAERVAAVQDAIGDVSIRCHFHNTRNTGMANAYAAVEAGIGVLDASLGGHRWLPVRATGGRQHPHRGPRLHARAGGRGDRRVARAPDRRRRVARRAARPGSPRSAVAGRTVPVPRGSSTVRA